MKKEQYRGFVFYTRDYFGDAEVRLMPGRLRIVWVEAFFLMDQSPRRGVLLKKNGEPYLAAELAKIVNVLVEDVEQAFEWIIREGIGGIDRQTKALMCRRMVRDEHKRKTSTKNGRKGGNPDLVAKRKSIENQTKIDRKLEKPTTSSHPVTQTGYRELDGPVNPRLIPSDNTKTEPEPEPEPDLANTVSISSPLNSPPAEKQPSGRPRDLAMDLFSEKFQECTGVPYVIETGDAVQLARLRKAFGIEPRGMPPGWPDSVVNYLGSPLAQWSLADLANPKRYAVFINSALDSYNKPVNHRARQHDTQSPEQGKRSRTDDAFRRILSEAVTSPLRAVPNGIDRWDAQGLPVRIERTGHTD